MMFFFNRFMIICLVIFYSFSLSSKQKNEKFIIGYLPTWKNWQMEDIQGDKLSIIKISFFEINNNEVIYGKGTTKYSFQEQILRVLELKKVYPHLKIIFSVGGWNIDGFSDIAADYKHRRVFAKSLVRLIEKYDADGIDIDWEFPVNGAWGLIKSREADRENLNLLLEEIRNEFDKISQKNKKEYILSLAVGVGGWITKSFDFYTASLYVDYFGVMAYNIVTRLDDKTGHHAAIYKSKNSWSTQEGINLILEQKIDASQIVVGMPFYGRQKANVERSRRGLYKDFQGTGGKSSVTYNFVKEHYFQDKSFKHYFDNKAKADYLYSKEKGIFVTFMGEKGAKALANYVNNNNFKGIMIWEITQDNEEKTLLNTTYNALN